MEISTRLKSEVDLNNECCCKYHLMSKIKEWANEKDYWCISGYDDGYFCMVKDMPDNKWFYADTEFEAVVKAGEWVLEQEVRENEN